jgi:hypothetical protein
LNPLTQPGTACLSRKATYLSHWLSIRASKANRSLKPGIPALVIAHHSCAVQVKSADKTYPQRPEELREVRYSCFQHPGRINAQERQFHAPNQYNDNTVVGCSVPCQPVIRNHILARNDSHVNQLTILQNVGDAEVRCVKSSGATYRVAQAPRSTGPRR